MRPILLSERPTDGTHSIYVKGQVVTTLRFEQPVDAGRTKMMGWEGRLEPLAVVRNKVFLEPIRDLNRDEGIPLVGTLADGMEIPFLLRPPWSREDGGGRRSSRLSPARHAHPGLDVRRVHARRRGLRGVRVSPTSGPPRECHWR